MLSARVSERLSARGLGLNSSPGQPSRKCVSFLTKQSWGAGEWLCRSVESRLHLWKNNSKFMTPWLRRCDSKGWSRLSCFLPTRLGLTGPDERPVPMSSHSGESNASSTGLSSLFASLMAGGGGEGGVCCFITSHSFYPTTTSPQRHS